ncbi:MAG: hypothetical protein O2897_01925 [bacterium]|nr:hypothetical protein [bacterium]
MEHVGKIHWIALSLIALAFVAKLISLLFFRELHVNLAVLEFFSVGVYFAYIGWLGYLKLNEEENNDKFVAAATFLILLDILTYYIFKGWV